MRYDVGRHVYGAAAILFGICALAFRDFNVWQQIRPLGNIPYRELALYLVAAIEILGGIAIQFQRTARAGALALGALYFAFALLWLPIFLAKPHVYDSLGNFFEQFSMVSGALIVYATFDRRNPAQAGRIARTGYYGFAISVVSFTLEQLIYLRGTADFIPNWIPWHMFWAVATTIAFALAAIALLTGRSALLAARLTTAMIVGFGLLIWLPAPFSHPHGLNSWTGNAENLGIAGSAWILADYLRAARRR
ncbi:MAG TPA: hypothetical protein VMF11_01540 [Candidatus Baltobacteraceae bacterium]|nr:hypothetical protein [Candidatus Baltobacteraceae bacterium]